MPAHLTPAGVAGLGEPSLEAEALKADIMRNVKAMLGLAEAPEPPAANGGRVMEGSAGAAPGEAAAQEPWGEKGRGAVFTAAVRDVDKVWQQRLGASVGGGGRRKV